MRVENRIAVLRIEVKGIMGVAHFLVWIAWLRGWIKVFHQPHVGLFLTNIDDDFFSVRAHAGVVMLDNIAG